MMVSITKNKRLQSLLFILFWLLLWEVAAKIVNMPVILPSISQTLHALVGMAQHADFYRNVSLSLLRVFWGVGASIVVGIVLGIFSGLYDAAYRFFNPIMSVIKATPVVSFIILALVWMKTDNIPIFVCFLMCVPIIWTNVMQGVRDTDKRLLQMCSVYQISKFRVIREVYLPSVRGYIFSSIAASIGIGWKSTVAAEVIARPEISIGGGMYETKIYLQTENLFALTLVVIVLSFIIEYAIKNLLNKLSKGKKSYVSEHSKSSKSLSG